MQNKSWQQIAATIATNVLDLHIMPTEQCNFRCVYCYESFHLGKMNPYIIKAIKEFIRQRMPELKQLRISWFGGEPLAATDVVLDISNYAKNLVKSSACSYNFGMTTNGYLLDVKRFISLINAGVSSFQISLDGPRGLHDQTRKRADGAGTFDRIWHNLNEIKQLYHDYEIILRIHVTPDNFRSLPYLITQLKLNFKHDKRFKLFFKAIENLGGPNTGMFSILGNKAKSEIIANLIALVGDDIPIHSINPDNQTYICYASSQNSWVIRSNGTLAKCTVALEDDRNAVGRINPNGTLNIDEKKMQLWLRGLKNNDALTMSCPAYGLPALKSIPVMVTLT